MKNNLSKLFVGLAAFLMIAAMADTNYAQRRTRSAVYSAQQVEVLLERIEERTDKFSNQLNKSLDRSRLNSTRTEDNITRRVTALENAADEIRREYDHRDTRGETARNARKVLNAATVVDRLMRSRNYGRLTESMWVAVRSDINTLARIYRLPAVGARTYR
jgi:hypothetical protein